MCLDASCYRLGTLSQVQGVKKEASTAGGKICLILLDLIPVSMSSQATVSCGPDIMCLAVLGSRAAMMILIYLP